jgi:hypothetical protein
VFAIRTISEESGAVHDCKAGDCVHGETDLSKYPPRYNKFTRDHAVPIAHPNTIFGSSFDNGGLHRLVVPQKNDRIEEVLKMHTQIIHRSLCWSIPILWWFRRKMGNFYC